VGDHPPGSSESSVPVSWQYLQIPLPKWSSGIAGGGFFHGAVLVGLAVLVVLVGLAVPIVPVGLAVLVVPVGPAVLAALVGLAVLAVPVGPAVTAVSVGPAVLAVLLSPAGPAQVTVRSSPPTMAEAINSFLSRLSPFIVARWASPVGFRSSHLYRVKTVSGDRRNKHRYCPPLLSGPAQPGTTVELPRPFPRGWRGKLCIPTCQNGYLVSPVQCQPYLSW